MILALIAAHDDRLVIGHQGGLPWHVPADLRYFQKMTKGHVLIMGRRTYESIGEEPLRGRENAVISRTGTWENVPTFTSVDEALAHFQDRELVYIGGGSGLYEETISYADRLVLTHIHGTHEGDTFFPEYRDEIGTTWQEVFREEHDTHTFLTYERIRKPA